MAPGAVGRARATRRGGGAVIVGIGLGVGAGLVGVGVGLALAGTDGGATETGVEAPDELGMGAKEVSGGL